MAATLQDYDWADEVLHAQLGRLWYIPQIGEWKQALAYGDPTHRHQFSTIAIRSLAEPRFAHYTDVRFRVVHVTLDMWLPYRAAGLGVLFNRLQESYEKYLAFLFTTMNIRAEFEVVK